MAELPGGKRAFGPRSWWPPRRPARQPRRPPQGPGTSPSPFDSKQPPDPQERRALHEETGHDGRGSRRRVIGGGDVPSRRDREEQEEADRQEAQDRARQSRLRGQGPDLARRGLPISEGAGKSIENHRQVATRPALKAEHSRHQAGLRNADLGDPTVQGSWERNSQRNAVGEPAERGPQRSSPFRRGKRDGLEQRQTVSETGGDHRHRLAELLLHHFRTTSHLPPCPNERDDDRRDSPDHSAREAGDRYPDHDASERADRSKGWHTKPTSSASPTPIAPPDPRSRSDALSLHQIGRHGCEQTGQRSENHRGH